MSSISSLGGAGGVQQIMAMRQQIIDRSQLLQQIHTNVPAGPAVGGTSATSAPATGTTAPAHGFADALKQALDSVNATQNNSDAISAAYEKGEVTDVAKVMLARQQSGVAFEATLQVRNKLLSAYQDIMKLGV